MSLELEIEKRKTFGIISHPDAGKTTLTEKLLLFGGAIQSAGAVKNNKIKKKEIKSEELTQSFIKNINNNMLNIFTMTYLTRIFPYYNPQKQRSPEKNPLGSEIHHRYQQNLIQRQSHYL